MISLSARKARRLVLSGFALTTLFASAAGAQNRALFSEPSSSSASAAVSLSEPAVVRSRRAIADVSLLAESSRSGASADGFSSARLAARSVDLNLFTDVDLVAQLERVELVAPLATPGRQSRRCRRQRRRARRVGGVLTASIMASPDLGAAGWRRNKIAESYTADCDSRWCRQ